MVLQTGKLFYRHISQKAHRLGTVSICNFLTFTRIEEIRVKEAAHVAAILRVRALDSEVDAVEDFICFTIALRYSRRWPWSYGAGTFTLLRVCYSSNQFSPPINGLETSQFAIIFIHFTMRRKIVGFLFWRLYYDRWWFLKTDENCVQDQAISVLFCNEGKTPQHHRSIFFSTLSIILETYYQRSAFLFRFKMVQFHPKQ